MVLESKYFTGSGSILYTKYLKIELVDHLNPPLKWNEGEGKEK